MNKKKETICSLCKLSSIQQEGNILRLNCGHSLCSHCISTFQNQSQKSEINCSNCEQRTTIDKLKVAFHDPYQNALEAQSNYSNNQKPPVYGKKNKLLASVTMPQFEGSFQQIPSFKDFPTEESAKRISEKKKHNIYNQNEGMIQVDFNTTNSLELVAPSLSDNKNKQKEFFPEKLDFNAEKKKSEDEKFEETNSDEGRQRGGVDSLPSWGEWNSQLLATQSGKGIQLNTSKSMIAVNLVSPFKNQSLPQNNINSSSIHLNIKNHDCFEEGNEETALKNEEDYNILKDQGIFLDKNTNNGYLSSQVQCSSHPGEISNLFCFDCLDECMCVECLIGKQKHSQHEVKNVKKSFQNYLLPIVKIAKDKVIIRQNDLHLDETMILRKIKEIREEGEQKRKDIQRKGIQIANELNQRVMTIITQMREHEDKLLQKIIRIKEKTGANLLKMHEISKEYQSVMDFNFSIPETLVFNHFVKVSNQFKQISAQIQTNDKDLRSLCLNSNDYSASSLYKQVFSSLQNLSQKIETLDISSSTKNSQTPQQSNQQFDLPYQHIQESQLTSNSFKSKQAHSMHYPAQISGKSSPQANQNQNSEFLSQLTISPENIQPQSHSPHNIHLISMSQQINQQPQTAFESQENQHILQAFTSFGENLPNSPVRVNQSQSTSNFHSKVPQNSLLHNSQQINSPSPAQSRLKSQIITKAKKSESYISLKDGSKKENQNKEAPQKGSHQSFTQYPTQVVNIPKQQTPQILCRQQEICDQLDKQQASYLKQNDKIFSKRPSQEYLTSNKIQLKDQKLINPSRNSSISSIQAKKSIENIASSQKMFCYPHLSQEKLQNIQEGLQDQFSSLQILGASKLMNHQSQQISSNIQNYDGFDHLAVFKKNPRHKKTQSFGGRENQLLSKDFIATKPSFSRNGSFSHYQLNSDLHKYHSGIMENRNILMDHKSLEEQLSKSGNITSLSSFGGTTIAEQKELSTGSKKNKSISFLRKILHEGW